MGYANRELDDLNRLMEDMHSAISQEAEQIKQRMLNRAVENFVQAGFPNEEAYDLAVKELYFPVVPKTFSLPSFDDL